MSQIASLKPNQSLFASNSIPNFTLNRTRQEVPKWLLEFGNFTRDEQAAPISEQKQSRPLTDNHHLCTRPKWFEELSQKRRLSDIVSMNTTNQPLMPDSDEMDTTEQSLPPPKPIATNFAQPQLPQQQKNKPPSHLNQPQPTMPANTTERRLSTEFVFMFQENSFNNTDRSNNGSGNSEHKSSVFLSPADLLEEEILALSATKSVEKLNLGEFDLLSEECIIPEMPSGNELQFSLLDNWGDEQYIGMNGIEIFDPMGKRPAIKNIYLQDVNKGRQQLTDLSKLVDNVYRTHDDSHIWQYRMGKKGRASQLPVEIVMQLKEPTTIALLRVWNHNKSRIHSYRGVRYLQIKFNDKLIFSGEIAKATGDLTGSFENFGDTILFTTKETILEQISHHDISFQELLMEPTTIKL